MTLVILLLAVLILAITTGPAQSASTGQPQAGPAPRHACEPEAKDEALPNQPLLDGTGLSNRKATPVMAAPARSASPWQGAASLALNPAQLRAIRTMAAHPDQGSISAIHARIPSGVTLARAQQRAL
jgi:hypothetical protein